jgi:AN1-type zinc finger protein 2
MDLDVGAHCDFESCGRLDFLPTNCVGCRKTFCAEHHAFASHHCYSGRKERRAIECPLCREVITVKESEDADYVMNTHIERSCPQKRTKSAKKKRPRCVVEGCKVKDSSAMVECKHCGQRVCLKHRWEEDHNCPGFEKRQKKQAKRNRKNMKKAAKMHRADHDGDGKVRHAVWLRLALHTISSITTYSCSLFRWPDDRRGNRMSVLFLLGPHVLK